MLKLFVNFQITVKFYVSADIYRWKMDKKINLHFAIFLPD